MAPLGQAPTELSARKKTLNFTMSLSSINGFPSRPNETVLILNLSLLF